MSTTSTAPLLTPPEVIDRARAARVLEQAAAADQLEMAHAWALLHPCAEGETPAHWGEVDLHGEATVPLAGTGAPLVAEFAPADLAAALGVTHDAALDLVADALELAYRLPRLSGHVRAGRIPAWRARRIAQLTRDLSLEAAAYAARLVNEARLYFDPDRAAADQEEALATRGVWLRHREGAPGTTEVSMTLDTPDAQLLGQTLNRVAADLRDLGDTDTRDVRRARAAGILADPQHALDLMSGRDTSPTKNARTSTVNIYVHLTLADLALGTRTSSDAGTGAATVERLGTITTDLLHDWLTHYTNAGTKIIIRPVLDTRSAGGAERAVDQHDPPPWMREIVLLREAQCVFPACGHGSRSCDLDHITEYLPIDDGGPPGQTRPDNLAPLCRTHHRIKTHTPGPTNASTPAATPGPAPPDTSTTSLRCPAAPTHADPPPEHARPRLPPGRGHRRAHCLLTVTSPGLAPRARSMIAPPSTASASSLSATEGSCGQRCSCCSRLSPNSASGRWSSPSGCSCSWPG